MNFYKHIQSNNYIITITFKIFEAIELFKHNNLSHILLIFNKKIIFEISVITNHSHSFKRELVSKMSNQFVNPHKISQTQ